MIAGFFPAASLAIHLGRDEPAGEGWAEQKMIDPQIPCPSAMAAVPQIMA